MQINSHARQFKDKVLGN